MISTEWKTSSVSICYPISHLDAIGCVTIIGKRKILLSRIVNARAIIVPTCISSSIVAGAR